MTKILGVVGSPRKKGNTHVLVSRILEGAAGGGADTETLFLRKMKIRECDGCHTYWKGKRCSKRAIIAVPYEEQGPEAAELVVAFFERSLAYLEMDLVGQILAPGVGPRGAILEQDEVLLQAQDLGRRLAQGNPGQRAP
jgi:hypothetical protein